MVNLRNYFYLDNVHLKLFFLVELLWSGLTPLKGIYLVESRNRGCGEGRGKFSKRSFLHGVEYLDIK